jgi:quercetin dioxygenase-like cupin family protein
MLRGTFLMFFILILTASSVFAQDPVKVDAKHYTVEFENSHVRVLRIKYGPHEKSVMHRHPNSVAIFQTDAQVKFTFPNGKTQDAGGKAGQVTWNPASTHLPENTGEQPFEAILVELKSGHKRPAKKPNANTNTNTEKK